MNDELQSELDAIRPAPNMPLVEPEDWQSTSERIIRQTLAELRGRDSRILNLTLLCRYPFKPDQTEAKTVWYTELRRQTNPAETTESESALPTRSTIPRSEWVETVQSILRESLELYNPYSKQNPGQWADDTRKLEAFFLELRRRLPFEMDPDELPLNPGTSASEVEQHRSYHREFRAIWYQECARTLGFQDPPPRAISLTTENQAPAVKVKRTSTEKQKKLF